MAKRLSERRSEKLAFWRLALETWRAGGKTVREFCRDEGLSEASFYAWRKRLADVDGKASGSRSSSPACPEPPAATAGEPFISLGMLSTSPCEAMEVVLDDRPTIRIRPGFDRDTFRRVVSVLAELAC